MAYTVIVAFLVASIVVSAVVAIQAGRASLRQTERARQRAIAQLATDTHGVVTARVVAEHLSIPYPTADRLLRDMVDDVHLRMTVDDEAAELRFEFVKIVESPQVAGAGLYRRIRSG